MRNERVLNRLILELYFVWKSTRPNSHRDTMRDSILVYTWNIIFSWSFFVVCVLWPNYSFQMVPEIDCQLQFWWKLAQSRVLYRPSLLHPLALCFRPLANLSWYNYTRLHSQLAIDYVFWPSCSQTHQGFPNPPHRFSDSSNQCPPETLYILRCVSVKHLLLNVAKLLS